VNHQEAQDQKMVQIIARCWSDPAFKAKLLADPVATLQSLGIDIPTGVQLRILADTEHEQHLVIPCPPAGLSDTQLEAIAGGWRVSQEVVDAVTQANVKRAGDSAVQLPNLIYRMPFTWRL